MRFIITFLTIAILAQCSQPTTTEVKIDYQRQIANQSVLSTLWFQQSAEMTAAYLQAYRYARILLDEKIENRRSSKQGGVVLDIDETVLDNSPEAVRRIKSGKTFNSTDWKNWTDEASAEALPGVKEFVDYATEQGIEVFYISNRKVAELEATIKNLQDLGFPNADEQHVLLKSTTSDKTERRAIVSEQVDVLVYVGDNLKDFLDIYGERGDDLGKDLVMETKENLLNNFVILPNPMYGEWEKPYYGGNMGMADSSKVEARYNILKD